MVAVFFIFILGVGFFGALEMLVMEVGGVIVSLPLHRVWSFSFLSHRVVL